MGKTIEEAISELQAQINELGQEINKKKTAVNTLCEVAGNPAIYIITDDAPNKLYGNFRSDEFYGQPLASCVGRILESRKAASLGSASPDELYAQLISGGFKFESKSDVNAKRALIIALSKNTAKFHRLPNGEFGLVEWYPKAKKTNVNNPDEKNKEELQDESQS